jgi:hypothetical protein
MDVESTRQGISRRPRVGGDEVDALNPGHRVYAWRPGERKRIKAGANRRERRGARRTLRGRY